MKNVIIAIGVVAAIFCIYWFFFTPDNQGSYDDEITIYRHRRAEFYRNSQESPFIEQNVPFTYLAYFPVNPAFNIIAEFTPSPEPANLALATSTGGFDTLKVAGRATFEWDGQTQSLLVLGSGNDLFIPFQDATSGQASYGGGRYLEVFEPKRGKIVLDFNKCYNPYCAYTEGYTCPFPPKENRLNIAVEAGEKTYQGH